MIYVLPLSDINTSNKSKSLTVPSAISDYSYMAETENVEEICRIIAAFGTGITDFQMVEVPAEKVLGHLPKKIQEDLLADMEKKTVDRKTELDEAATGIIMRSNRDFFILNIDKEGNMICRTIKFSHGKKNILFELSEESDGTVRLCHGSFIYKKILS